MLLTGLEEAGTLACIGVTGGLLGATSHREVWQRHPVPPWQAPRARTPWFQSCHQRQQGTEPLSQMKGGRDSVHTGAAFHPCFVVHPCKLLCEAGQFAWKGKLRHRVVERLAQPPSS